MSEEFMKQKKCLLCGILLTPYQDNFCSHSHSRYWYSRNAKKAVETRKNNDRARNAFYYDLERKEQYMNDFLKRTQKINGKESL